MTWKFLFKLNDCTAGDRNCTTEREGSLDLKTTDIKGICWSSFNKLAFYEH